MCHAVLSWPRRFGVLAIMTSCAVLLVGTRAINADIIGHYTFDNQSNLGADSSGLGNNATSLNNVGWTPSGVAGGAAVFNASILSRMAWTGVNNPIANVPSCKFAQ